MQWMLDGGYAPPAMPLPVLAAATRALSCIENTEEHGSRKSQTFKLSHRKYRTMAARTNLDMDVLRTFVLGFELGSFARAADRL